MVVKRVAVKFRHPHPASGEHVGLIDRKGAAVANPHGHGIDDVAADGPSRADEESRIAVGREAEGLHIEGQAAFATIDARVQALPMCRPLLARRIVRSSIPLGSFVPHGWPGASKLALQQPGDPGAPPIGEWVRNRPDRRSSDRPSFRGCPARHEVLVGDIAEARFVNRRDHSPRLAAVLVAEDKALDDRVKLPASAGVYRPAVANPRGGPENVLNARRRQLEEPPRCACPRLKNRRRRFQLALRDVELAAVGEDDDTPVVDALSDHPVAAERRARRECLRGGSGLRPGHRERPLAECAGRCREKNSNCQAERPAGGSHTGLDTVQWRQAPPRPRPLPRPPSARPTAASARSRPIAYDLRDQTRGQTRRV